MEVEHRDFILVYFWVYLESGMSQSYKRHIEKMAGQDQKILQKRGKLLLYLRKRQCYNEYKNTRTSCHGLVFMKQYNKPEMSFIKPKNYCKGVKENEKEMVARSGILPNLL